MRTFALLIGVLASGTALSASAASALDAVLACEEAGAWSRGHEDLAASATAAGFSCREHNGVRSLRLSCTGGTARAFGTPVREFELARQADGSRILSVVLNSGPAAVRPKVPEGVSTDTGMHVELDTREDGRAEVRCRMAGDLPPHGSVAGTLDFRGQQPVPAMRVCATPVDRRSEPTCVLTSTGQRDYVIEHLPAGDYYLTAFATEDNPNRLFGVYSSPMADCPSSTGCERQRLQKVTVLPGEVHGAIDPNTLMPELPAILRGR